MGGLPKSSTCCTQLGVIVAGPYTMYQQAMGRPSLLDENAALCVAPLHTLSRDICEGNNINHQHRASSIEAQTSSTLANSPPSSILVRPLFEEWQDVKPRE